MEAKLRTYLINWNFMRFLRLAMGIYVGIQAITFQSWAYGLISALFLFQALSNTGCCSTAGCSTTPMKKAPTNEIKFEEIKN